MEKKRAALSEFNDWEASSPYTVFNGQEVCVMVDVKEVYTGFDAISVALFSPTDTSMSWGGVTQEGFAIPNIITAATHIIDWQPDTQEVMFLKGNQYNTENETYNGVAMHEFGHSLGLGDAYDAPYIPLIYRGDGGDQSKTSLAKHYNKNEDEFNLAMGNQSPVKPIEIEMVILAFSTGKRQNFGKQAYYQTISEAIR